MVNYNKDDDLNPPSGIGSSGSEKKSGETKNEKVNSRTVIFDASCAPVNLDLLSIGLINDMYAESRNDEYKYDVNMRWWLRRRILMGSDCGNDYYLL